MAGSSGGSSRKHGRQKKKPAHMRYTNESRWIVNSEKKQKKHEKKQKAFKERRQQLLERLKYTKAKKIMERVNDVEVNTSHIRPELIEKAKKRISEYTRA